MLTCLHCAQVLLSSKSPVAVAATCVASAGLAPSTEELIYRGFLLRSLTGSLPFPAAVRASTHCIALICHCHVKRLSSKAAATIGVSLARDGNRPEPFLSV